MTTVEYAVTLGNLIAVGIVILPFTAPTITGLLRHRSYPHPFSIVFWRAVLGMGIGYLVANAITGHIVGLVGLCVTLLPTVFALRPKDFRRTI